MNIRYRAEIDGLRAIAVFSVIIYHANIKFFNHLLFQGGFLGVDIFFVISGYLISSLILKEIKLTNKFSFSNFYIRRVKRIAPALVFMLILSTIVSYFFLLPISFVIFLKSLISSLLSVSNLYFWKEANSYGAESSLLNPLLHTWSLSIEEQFYILFPISIFLIHKFFKKHLIELIFSGILISLIFAQYCSINHAAFNFYALPSRGFELLIGSLLAKLELDRNRGGGGRNSYLILNKIFPLTGLALIFYSIFFFKSEMLLPSFYSLIPVVGTMLIIWFAHKDELITRILSCKIFVFFGLISYSLYLFHFPIFAFARNINLNEADVVYKILLILLTVIISIASYYYVEKTFRKKYPFQKIIIILLISVFCLVCINIYGLYKDGFKHRVASIFWLENLKNEQPVNFNSKGTNGNILLIGDSHADALSFKLNENLTKENYNLTYLDTELFTPNLNKFDHKTNVLDKNFKISNDKIKNFLDNEKDLIIVFHQRWTVKILSTHFDNEEGTTEYLQEKDKYWSHVIKKDSCCIDELQRINLVQKEIISSIDLMLAKGHKIILVYPVPEMAFDVPKTIFKKKKIFINHLNEENVPIITTSYEVYKKRNKLIFETLDSIQSSNIYRVYPHQHFCNTLIQGKCIGNSKKEIFYYDDDHLSLKGSSFIVTDIVNTIKRVDK